MHPAGRAAIYAAVIVASMYFLQDRLLYHPGGESLPEVMRLAQARQLAPWPDAIAYRAWLAEPAGPARGTVVVFHGNAGLALHRSYYADALTRRGLRVLLAEYPGYGARPGRVGEASLTADGALTLRRAHAAFGEPLYLFGESLGAGVAAAVAAARPVPVAGVALITPWATLPDLAQSIYWFLPARWLVRDRYDNVANLAAFGGPVAVVIAERDEIVPAAHGARLYDAIGTPKRRWVLAGAGHNDWPVQPEAPWWDEVLAFLGAPPSR